jgi:O-antigen/teichoic acid export membrane protein
MRALSVSDFGAFSLFLSFIAIFGGLNFGINHIYQRYVAVYASDKSGVGRVFRLTAAMLVLRLLGFALVLTVAFVLAAIDVVHLDQIGLPYVWLAVATCIAGIVEGICREGMLSGYLDHKFYNVFDSAIIVAKAVLILAWRPLSVLTLAEIWVGLELVRALVVTSRFMYLSVARTQSGSASRERLEYRRYFDYGKYFVLASLTTQVLAFDIDSYFLGYFWTTREVGLYSFATKVAFLLVGLAPANLLFNVFTPLATRDYDAAGSTLKIRRAVDVLFKLNVFGYGAIVLLALLNAEYFVRTLLGVKYLPALAYVPVLLAASFLPVIKSTFEPAARAMERSRVYLSTFTAAVFNIAGNALLIPILGIWGAVISTTFAMLVQTAAFVVFAQREIDFRFDWIFLARSGVNLALVGALVFALQPLVKLSLAGLLAGNVVVIGVFLALARLNRVFTAEEADYINKFLPVKAFIF